MTTTHATVVATVDLNGQDPEVVRTVVARALAEVGVVLVPCGWAPDMDTVADGCGLGYDDLALVDMNPNLTRR